MNSSALHRVEQEFQRNGVNISRQTMSNWIIRCAEKYFAPFVERMKQELLSLPVTQSDETPTQVIGDVNVRWLDYEYSNQFRCRTGMTYHEDVAVVKNRDSFKKRSEKGMYKADLFADL